MGQFDKNKIEKVYYENGKLKAEIETLGGKRHGYLNSYHENGQLRSIVKFENGIQVDGIVTSFDENGNKIKTSTIVNGLYQGFQTEWWPNGKLKIERLFGDNEIMSNTKEFDNNGDLKIISKYDDLGLLIKSEYIIDGIIEKIPNEINVKNYRLERIIAEHLIDLIKNYNDVDINNFKHSHFFKTWVKDYNGELEIYTKDDCEYNFLRIVWKYINSDLKFNSSWFYDLLANFYFAKNHFNQGVAFAARGCDYYEEEDILHTLANGQLKMNLLNPALKQIEKCIKLYLEKYNEENEEYYYTKAKIHIALNDDYNAVKALNKVKDLDPDYDIKDLIKITSQNNISDDLVQHKTNSKEEFLSILKQIIYEDSFDIKFVARNNSIIEKIRLKGTWKGYNFIFKCEHHIQHAELICDCIDSFDVIIPLIEKFEIKDIDSNAIALYDDLFIIIDSHIGGIFENISVEWETALPKEVADEIEKIGEEQLFHQGGGFIESDLFFEKGAIISITAKTDFKEIIIT
jgi:antitoxin component YwqK of YwqJK toxin-antitoxin module